MEVNEDQDIRFHICRNLKILDRMMDDHCNKDMEDIGLTGRQFDVIQYLAMCKQDRVKQVMIEKDFKLSNPTVSGILNRMEKNGFIRADFQGTGNKEPGKEQGKSNGKNTFYRSIRRRDQSVL